LILIIDFLYLLLMAKIKKEAQPAKKVVVVQGSKAAAAR
jgi:hypothetical protein